MAEVQNEVLEAAVFRYGDFCPILFILSIKIRWGEPPPAQDWPKIFVLHCPLKRGGTGTSTSVRDITVEEVFPHSPETIWKTLTTGALIGRWLLMTPIGFEPVPGRHFTLQTTPAGAWDGIIRFQVLEVISNQRLLAQD